MNSGTYYACEKKLYYENIELFSMILRIEKANFQNLAMWDLKAELSLNLESYYG